MAWPQAPQPAPAPAAPAGNAMALPVGPIVTAVGAFLTFVFSFVQIVKADSDLVDVGWSVWTTQPGFFGVGTWIPLFALLAGAAALARAFVRGLDQKQVAGFGPLQVQLAATAFAVLLWLGYVISVLLADNAALGLGALLLLLSLAALVAGTVLSLLDAKKGRTTTIGTASGPPSGQWAPTGPQPHPGGPASGQWPPPTPPPSPQPQAPQPQQWPPQGAQAPQGWDPGAPAAPGQWQPDPAGQPAPDQQPWSPPPGPEQAWAPPAAGGPAPSPSPAPAPPGPVPEPGPLDPQPAPPVDPGGPARGGGLFDPGTEVIPGPPPAPPADDPGHVGGGPDALPPIPPSNTP